MSPIIGVIDSQKSGRLATDYFESLISYDASGSTVYTTLSGISQSYKHLRLVITGVWNSGSNANLSLKPNSDGTNANYILHRYYGNGGTTYAYTYDNVGGMFYNYTGIGATNYASIIDIFDYSRNDIYKTYTAKGGNTGTYQWNESGLWRSTSPITSIDVYIQGTTGTRISLYGVK